MKICKECGNISEDKSVCPECGSLLTKMSEKEEIAYNNRLGKTAAKLSSRSYGLYSTASDRVLGSLSLFGSTLHVMCLLWASMAADPGYVGTYSVAGIIFLIFAAVGFLAPKLLWKLVSIRIRLISDNNDPTPSAVWITGKNIAKYTEFALGMMFLLLALIEIL